MSSRISAYWVPPASFKLVNARPLCKPFFDNTHSKFQFEFWRVLMHNIAFYSWLKNTKTHRNKKRHLDSSFCVAKHIWSVTSSHKTHEEFSLYTLKTLHSIFLINILLNLAANIMGKVQINWTNLAHQIYTRIAKNQVKENHDKLQLKY